MFISTIRIRNFRCFGDIEQTISFNSGLNMLIGENDSGKSAILDAIRIVLGTTDQSWYRIQLSDFNNEDMTKEISIVIKFDNLSDIEQAAFLECLTHEKTKNSEGVEVITPSLYIHWKCKYLMNFVPPRPYTTSTTGMNGDGVSLPQESKELLRVTYLRALRDAYGDMQSGRNSRLSQILQSTEGLKSGKDEYIEGDSLSELSIAGIADLTNKLLAAHPQLKGINDELTKIVQNKMLLKNDSVKTKFEVSGTNTSEEKKLISLLEKLDLALDKSNNNLGKVGLGTSNILSMACEMLLNGESQNSSFLLIEEPEAHIHAQRQLKVIQSLQDEAKGTNQQVVLSTHSPLLASVVSLNNIILIRDGKPFSLEKGQTQLDDEDYLFLERHLDATKANLFFAKSVIVVEGPSEELLLPTIAEICNRNLTDYGVSIVNARGTGLSRFSKIFQRVDTTKALDIKVACVTDRDILPDCAPAICINEKYTTPSEYPERRKWRTESEIAAKPGIDAYIKSLRGRSEGQYVKTFISEHWTLEYDLAYEGLAEDMIDALVIVKYDNTNREKKAREIRDKLASYATKEEQACYIYSFFSDNSTSKGEFAQQLAILLEGRYRDKSEELISRLPPYLLNAIEYVIS